MDYKKLNNITGWVVFVIAAYVYVSTIEPTASWWDCGEYITTSHKLEVGHPPGAPTFMILGAIFSSFTGPESVAAAINTMSALSSAFAILFLFWSITMLALKLSPDSEGDKMDVGRIIAVLGSGIVGALGFTFTDSMWFNAVEGEVYAMSTLLTAATFWAALKWDAVANSDPHADKWLVLIFYLIGLSVGVHLLNLLAIPSVVYIYYFRKYKFSIKGFVIAGTIGSVLLGMVQAVIIPGIPKLAGWFETLFVNSFGTGFNVGSFFFAVLLLVIVALGIFYSSKLKRAHLNTALVSFAVLVIGYSTFAMIIIRSNANPPLDENNPETMSSLVSYLGREQYGSWPVLSGPFWNSPVVEYLESNPSYAQVFVLENDAKKIKLRKNKKDLIKARLFKRDAVKIGVNLADSKGALILQKGNVTFSSEWDAKEFLRKLENLYVKYGEEFRLPFKEAIGKSYINVNEGVQRERVYHPDFVSLFPRMHNPSGQESGYIAWSGYEGNKDYPVPRLKNQYDKAMAAGDYKTANSIKAKGMYKPTAGEQWRYFSSYQFGWMYLRYFLWNFAGRQNDVQGFNGMRAYSNALTEGNWISGVDFVDQSRLGSREEVPNVERNHKSHNLYYFLPLILGLIGMVFQVVRAPKDWFVVFLLFLFTGVMIVVYLNQKPAEPRERDYAYCGSYYAFAIWIGLGVYALFDCVRNLEMKELIRVSGMVFGAGILGWLFSEPFGYSLLFMGFVAVALLLLMVGLGKVNQNPKIAAIVALVVCLPVPIILASENWDDHDRSGRYAARDFAYNYLMSCDKNAILFAAGDNDTFPLWYIQDVEGIRTDVRVVNLSLLGMDWHANQAKRKAYDSDPVPFNMPESRYRANNRSLVLLEESQINKKIKDYNKQLKAKNEQIAKINLSLPPSGQQPLLKEKQFVYMPAAEAINFACNDANRRKTLYSVGRDSYIKSKRFSIKVDIEAAKRNEIIPPGYQGKIESKLEWSTSSGYLGKADLLILDLLANYKWDRPIYFVQSQVQGAHKGLKKYFQAEGLVYKLTPIVATSRARFNVDKSFKLFMGEDYSETCKAFRWGNIHDDLVFVDHFTKIFFVTGMRASINRLAQQLILEGKKDEAVQLLNRCMEVMPVETAGISRSVPITCSSYFSALGESNDAEEKGLELSKKIFTHSMDKLEYYISLNGEAFDKSLDDLAYELGIIDLLTGRMKGKGDPIIADLGFGAIEENLKAKLAQLMTNDPKLIDGIRDPRKKPALPYKMVSKWFPQLYK